MIFKNSFFRILECPKRRHNTFSLSSAVLIFTLVSVSVSVSVPLSHSAFAQDITLLGGELTTTIPGRNALQVAAPNVVDEAKRQAQLAGFTPFHRRLRKKDGLGPRFVNTGCGACHINNGRGPVRLTSKKGTKNKMVVKVSLRGLQPNGAPTDVPRVGEQLQDRSFGRARHRLLLRWKRTKGSYPDGTPYTLRSPRLRFRIPGVRREDVVSSLRMTPGLNGLGLIESISEEDVLALSDPLDANADGISGVPQYVPERTSGTMQLGRFGFRASHPSVAQQSAAAAFFDMGVTTSIFNDSDEEPEIDDKTFAELVIYQELAGVPIARNQESADVSTGKELFKSIGCNNCHVMEFTSENALYPELHGQTIHPFTDLLLHDMGPGLADERAEFAASGSEWRTAPLWGLGFFKTVSKVPPRYLHDGRARSLEEAILWHGGEAEATTENFKNLSKTQRELLIQFLESI